MTSRWIDLMRTACAGLATRHLRAALSAAGVAIGIAAMVAVVGISESSRADLLSQLDTLGTNLLNVSPGQSFSGTDSKLPAEAAAMVRRIPPVESVSGTTSVGVSVHRTDRIPESETGGIAVRAADSELVETLRGSMARGTFLNAANSRYPVVVLGATAAERLGIARAGGQVWLGDRWFTVVGILNPMPLAPEIDRSALIGQPAAMELFGIDDSPSTLYVRTDQEAVEAVRGVLAATVNPAHPEEVQVSRPSDALAARAAAKTAFTSLFLGLGAVALLVGAVGVANVMVVAVLERRSEIGLRRALGAPRRSIRSQFLLESLMLSAVGGGTGVVLGFLIAAGYAGFRGWSVSLPVVGVAGGVVSALVIGGVAGLFPALRAARLSPTDALRTG